jgi:hypothetical protein
VVGGVVDHMQEDVVTRHRPFAPADKAESHYLSERIGIQRLGIVDISGVDGQLAFVQGLE